MLADNDSQRNVIKLNGPQKFIIGRVDEQLSAEVGHKNVIRTDISKGNGSAADIFFHYLGLYDFRVANFPKRSLANHHNCIQKHKELTDPTNYYPPLLGCALNFD